ncbi:hypothetical protein MBAV_003536 [Candidatus Magnetobacterium bavaricum]|uniref:Uncharacterized protein n=1 Tax=Candidatus Magnetobacterium bavaricum TaxID=29290 RepID=A0A0F3GQU8_9BACT|nr:hypothetical protein MBAV_003536 [Candidatus Magnetobacterium bavaricum]
MAKKLKKKKVFKQNRIEDVPEQKAFGTSMSTDYSDLLSSIRPLLKNDNKIKLLTGNNVPVKMSRVILDYARPFLDKQGSISIYNNSAYASRLIFIFSTNLFSW